MKKLFIVDLMPFLYKGHFVFLRNPRITASGINTSALLGLANGLLGVLRREKPDYLVLAMDSQGPTFRKEAYPAYKATRQKMPEDLAASIPYAFELADALNIPVVQSEGFEADDVIGTLSKLGAEAGFAVFLATPDKDAAQLVAPNVFLYRPAHAGDAAEIYDEAKVCEHWHLSSPAQMIDYLALAGDASDNIPGVKGVGEKTAIDLLARFGTVEGIIANAASLKGKLAKKVANGAKDAEVSKFLTTIRKDVPLTPDWEAYRCAGFDREKLAKVCGKFELTRFARELLSPEEVATLDAPSTLPLKTIVDTPHTYTLITTEDEARQLLTELEKEPRIAFDTETAAVDGHDSTEAHFCRLVGFSFATQKGKAWYVEGSLVDLFRPLFADPTKTFIAHNVKFDKSVLLRYGIGFATTPQDTMLAHYCLDAAARHGLDFLAEQELGYRPIPITDLIGIKERGKEQRSMADLKPREICDYASEDADIALQLADKLFPAVKEAGAERALREVEEPLVKVLIDMEKEGIRLDVAALKEYGRTLDAEILGILTKILDYSGPGFNPDSPRQLSELLFDKLTLSTEGIKKTTTGAYSTDEKSLSHLMGAHPIIPLILEYRACTKLKTTYVDKLPTLIDENGRIHTTFAQAFTETGRLSSSNPNLQNIPVRTPRGRLIRKAFIARDAEHVLISADYSQIELRLMAAFSKDESMLQAFRNGEDIHRETAARVYGIFPALVTPEQRAFCKMVNFGIIYGISAFGLSQRLKVSRKEAANLIETYFKLYPKVKAFMNAAIEKAREKGYAETILGRRRTLRDINSRNATARQGAERDAINTPIQGSAADLIKVAMVNIDKALRAAHLRTRCVLQIHDELLFDTPRDEVERVKEIVREEMIHAIDFGVPLEVGIGEGENWLAAH